MIDHVNPSATFSSWRDTTNEIIDQVNDVQTTISTAALTLSAPDQTVAQTPTFSGGLNTNSITPPGDGVLTVNGELSVSDGIVTLANVSYEFPGDQPADGNTILVNKRDGAVNNIEFQSLEAVSAAITVEALASLGAGVFTSTAVPVGIIHPAIPGGGSSPARWLPMNATSAALIYDEDPLLVKYDTLRTIYANETAFLAANGGDDTKLIKAELDPVSLFSVSHGGGLSFEKLVNDDLVATETFSIDTAKISLHLNSSQLEIQGGTALGVKAGGLSNATLATANTAATANYIPIRDGAGQLTVPITPSADEHASSKAYVDGAVAGNTIGNDIIGFPSTHSSYRTHGLASAIYQTIADDVIVFGNASDVRYRHRFGDAGVDFDAFGYNINRRIGVGVQTIYADQRAVYVQHTDGVVFAYGSNTKGSAGILDINKAFTSGEAAFDGDEISFVAANHDFASTNIAGVTGDRTALWVAGTNNYGQLGNNLATSINSGGIKLESSTSFGGSPIKDAQVVGGWNVDSDLPRTTIYVLTDAGTVYAAGYGNDGQCGRGNTTTVNNTFAPMEYAAGNPLAEGETIIGISTYGAQSRTGVFAISNLGNVYGCGSNRYGTLGLGNTTDQTRLVRVWTAGGGVPAAAEIYGDVGQTAHIITVDDQLYSAGDNAYGACGINSLSSDITSWTRVGATLGTCESFWSCAGRIRVNSQSGRWGTSRSWKFAIFKNTGVDTLYAWGGNEASQLGLGFRSDAVRAPDIVYMPPSVNLSLISDMSATFTESNGSFDDSPGTSILVNRAVGEIRSDIYIAGGTPYNHNVIPAGGIIPRFTRANRLI